MRAALVLTVILSGCAQPARVVVAPLPELDRTLAAPCADPGSPTDWADFDSTDLWMIAHLLPSYRECADRHRAVVREWENARERVK